MLFYQEVEAVAEAAAEPGTIGNGILVLIPTTCYVLLTRTYLASRLCVRRCAHQNGIHRFTTSD